MKIGIVIVNWNGKDDTVVLLDSLKKMKKGPAEVEVIVVDNGSTNDSVAVISAKYPWVRVIPTGHNLGFTGGNNVGIEYAYSHGADYIWLLNNDTVAHENALDVSPFEDPDVGIVGSKIYFAAGHEYHKERYAKNERGKVFWYAGGVVDWDNVYASHRGVDEVDTGQYDRREETPFVTGCSLMIRRSVIERIGYLDDRFYLYLEDLDYCLRAKKAGNKLVYNPASIIWHVNAGSSGGAGNPLHEYYLTRNRLLIGMQYASVRTKFAIIREAVKFLVSGSRIKRRAVADAFFGKWGKQYEPKKFAS